MAERKNLAKRIAMSFFGVIICAISVGIFKIAALGVSLFLIAGGKPAAIPTIAGVGTIITAFFMGPLIEFFNVHIARPMLAK
ncbi:hypothetical protein [Treponema sp. C6A8]|uniref:hypothetical protein n=1 Tax=Treponema sp. C6A8 TaxID=1410609 RepID=UPI0004891897|nr:hypothetical protein [Treponema sp. C6A8]